MIKIYPGEWKKKNTSWKFGKIFFNINKNVKKFCLQKNIIMKILIRSIAFIQRVKMRRSFTKILFFMEYHEENPTQLWNFVKKCSRKIGFPFYWWSFFMICLPGWWLAGSSRSSRPTPRWRPEPSSTPSLPEYQRFSRFWRSYLSWKRSSRRKNMRDNLGRHSWSFGAPLDDGFLRILWLFLEVPLKNRFGPIVLRSNNISIEVLLLNMFF